MGHKLLVTESVVLLGHQLLGIRVCLSPKRKRGSQSVFKTILNRSTLASSMCTNVFLRRFILKMDEQVYTMSSIIAPHPNTWPRKIGGKSETWHALPQLTGIKYLGYLVGTLSQYQNCEKRSGWMTFKRYHGWAKSSSVPMVDVPRQVRTYFGHKGVSLHRLLKKSQVINIYYNQ